MGYKHADVDMPYIPHLLEHLLISNLVRNVGSLRDGNVSVSATTERYRTRYEFQFWEDNPATVEQALENFFRPESFALADIEREYKSIYIEGGSKKHNVKIVEQYRDKNIDICASLGLSCGPDLMTQFELAASIDYELAQQALMRSWKQYYDRDKVSIIVTGPVASKLAKLHQNLDKTLSADPIKLEKTAVAKGAHQDLVVLAKAGKEALFRSGLSIEFDLESVEDEKAFDSILEGVNRGLKYYVDRRSLRDGWFAQVAGQHCLYSAYSSCRAMTWLFGDAKDPDEMEGLLNKLLSLFQEGGLDLDGNSLAYSLVVWLDDDAGLDQLQSKLVTYLGRELKDEGAIRYFEPDRISSFSSVAVEAFPKEDAPIVISSPAEGASKKQIKILELKSAGYSSMLPKYTEFLTHYFKSRCHKLDLQSIVNEKSSIFLEFNTALGMAEVVLCLEGKVGPELKRDDVNLQLEFYNFNNMSNKLGKNNLDSVWVEASTGIGDSYILSDSEKNEVYEVLGSLKLTASAALAEKNSAVEEASLINRLQRASCEIDFPAAFDKDKLIVSPALYDLPGQAPVYQAGIAYLLDDVDIEGKEFPYARFYTSAAYAQDFASYGANVEFLQYADNVVALFSLQTMDAKRVVKTLNELRSLSDSVLAEAYDGKTFDSVNLTDLPIEIFEKKNWAKDVFLPSQYRKAYGTRVVNNCQ
ncbi:hypothetical protein [uncultured Pseudoteredinibacter sp.]|uniref:hypothetical protein n=1 Tax=uncultured Pseudoteredinibacter sp. TaxID=1641701 RepID=UPI0026080612|nr:hypothetical protein [uncultured Pseudoteredinibacter sp.]